jgi:hypothetical protein
VVFGNISKLIGRLQYKTLEYKMVHMQYLVGHINPTQANRVNVGVFWRCTQNPTRFQDWSTKKPIFFFCWNFCQVAQPDLVSATETHMSQYRRILDESGYMGYAWDALSFGIQTLIRIAHGCFRVVSGYVSLD